MIAGAVLLLTSAGCRSARPELPTVVMTGTERGVTVAAELYQDEVRLQKVFGYDLPKAGATPIEISVSNDGPSRVLFRITTVALAVPDGREASPLSPMTIQARLARVDPGTMSLGPVLTLPANFIVFAIAAVANTVETARPIREVPSRELQDITLEKGMAVRGFLYFPNPLPGARLVVRFVDLDVLRNFEVVLPIQGGIGGESGKAANWR